MLIYRFSSTNPSVAIDGGDTIHNFHRGKDTLVLVDRDSDTTITTKAELIAWLQGTSGIKIHLNQSSGNFTQVTLAFQSAGTVDGQADGTAAGLNLVINFSSGFAVDTLKDIANTNNLLTSTKRIRASEIDEAVLDAVFGVDGLIALPDHDIGVDLL